MFPFPKWFKKATKLRRVCLFSYFYFPENVLNIGKKEKRNLLVKGKTSAFFVKFPLVILRFRKKTLFKHFTLVTISHLLLYWVPLTLGKHLSLSHSSVLSPTIPKGSLFPSTHFI